MNIIYTCVYVYLYNTYNIAVVTFQISDFTSDPNKVITILEDLNDTYQTEACDLDSLFDLV